MRKLIDQIVVAWNACRSRLQQVAAMYPDLIATTLVGAVVLLLLTSLDVTSDRTQRLPITLAYGVSYIAMFVVPVFMVVRHRWRQRQTLNRIRGIYAVASEWLMLGRTVEARRALTSIQRWEQHWRIGNSVVYRVCYSTIVVAVTAISAATHYVFYLNAYSQFTYGQVPHASIAETVQRLLNEPIQLWIFGVMSGLVGLASTKHLHDLKAEPWAEFYGDRLLRALNAGRTVNEAPRYEKPHLPLNVTARELLGLPERYTSADLRRAWLRLVRELHPDRWAAAGEDVRKMKEAALKRVNAARDELASPGYPPQRDTARQQ